MLGAQYRLIGTAAVRPSLRYVYVRTIVESLEDDSKALLRFCALISLLCCAQPGMDFISYVRKRMLNAPTAVLFS